VKAGGFSASSSLNSRPLGTHAPDVKITSNNKKSILATYTTFEDFLMIDRAVHSRRMKNRAHLVVVDIAYQSLGDSLDEDATGLRILVKAGLGLLVC